MRLKNNCCGGAPVLTCKIFPRQKHKQAGIFNCFKPAVTDVEKPQWQAREQAEGRAKAKPAAAVVEHAVVWLPGGGQQQQ